VQTGPDDNRAASPTARARRTRSQPVRWYGEDDLDGEQRTRAGVACDQSRRGGCGNAQMVSADSKRGEREGTLYRAIAFETSRSGP